MNEKFNGLFEFLQLMKNHPWEKLMEDIAFNNGEITRKFNDELSDSAVEWLARALGVPEEQHLIFKSVRKGENCIFFDELEKLEMPKVGDLLLMTGNSTISKVIKTGYKVRHPTYKKAISTHVAVIHADFICIDAIGDVGVSNRLITDVLTDVKDNWRVIRLKRELSDDELKKITEACVFYLYQPYKIIPNKKPIENFAYCSELARKIYKKAGIQNHGIPSSYGIHPAEFDKLADTSPLWIDVTDDFKNCVEFCRKYEMILKHIAKAFIDGLKLNRKRFNERKNWIKYVNTLKSQGKIDKNKAADITKTIRNIDSKMHHHFWDTKLVKSK